MLLLRVIHEGVCCVDAASPLPRAINLVPVDTFAAAIVRLAAMPTTPPVVHLGAAASVPLHTVCDWLRAAGHALAEVDSGEFGRRVRAAGEDHPFFPLKAALAQPTSTGGAAQVATVEPRVAHAELVLRELETERTLTKEGLRLSVEFLLQIAKG